MPEPTSPANVVDELAEEFARRWRAGELPSVEDYAARFPQWADELRAVLPAVVLMEQLKPRSDDVVAVSAALPGSGRPPERLGEYHIVREIGRGGMGVVYEAVQDALDRRVALKVLSGHLLTDDRSRSRFLREAQAAARLHHTNIVPVFGVGEQDGQCFYVMQLIDGRGLDQARDEAAPEAGLARLPPGEFCRAIARLGAQVADALAYAHGQGVLHRDIKPSNLLLDACGAGWVTDFGVAKVVEGAGLTQSGDLIGTLRYMPPERFAGHSDARGDVYSLAVTLYELLTSRPAFPDTTPQHLIRLITEEGPVRPRRLNPDIPTDLETILQKGMARDRAHRYQTAGELAEDLRRFLDDRPILARRTGPAGRLWRWCRRNPALAGVTAAAFLLMVAVTAVSLVANARTAAANRETASANREMEKALVAEKSQREHAESTATLALEALNRTYEQFAPTRLVVSPPAATEEGVELPLQQTALPPEVVPLLEDLLRTYEQIAHSSDEFPRLRAQVAQANHRIGDLRRRLGRFEAAAGAYRSAIDLYTRLLAESGSAAVRVKLARAYNELGRTLRALQQFEDAGRMHERAIQTLANAPRTFTDRPECRYELACSYYALGRRDMFLSPGGPPGPRREPKGGPRPKRPPPGRGPALSADHPTRRAVTLLERLAREFPSVPEYRHLLACCYRDLPPEPPGPRLAEAGRGRAVDLLRQLVADFPGVPDYRLDLCETLARLGPPGGTDAGARERLREAVALSADLVARYATVPEYAAAHARALDRLGMELLRANQLEEAVRCHRKAVAAQGRLVKQYPEVVTYGLWLGLMERSLGRALGARGELPEARVRLEAATARVESWWRKDPRLKGLRPFLAMAYRDLAEVLTRGGEPALAQEAVRKAEEFERDAVPGSFNPRERGRRL